MRSPHALEWFQRQLEQDQSITLAELRGAAGLDVDSSTPLDFPPQSRREGLKRERASDAVFMRSSLLVAERKIFALNEHASLLKGRVRKAEAALESEKKKHRVTKREREEFYELYVREKAKNERLTQLNCSVMNHLSQ